MQFNNFCNPKHQVLGNSQRLTQVLINLLDNARDASIENGIIAISSYEHENTIELWIEDEGEGITDEIKDQVFEPFLPQKNQG